MVCVQDYLDEYNVESIHILEILDMKGDYIRMALPDGENSIWVCESCGELVDPEEGCESCL
jgi:hypothetical protein